MPSQKHAAKINWTGRYVKGDTPAIDTSANIWTVTVPLRETLSRNKIIDAPVDGYVIRKAGYADIIIAYDSARKGLVESIVEDIQYVVDNAQSFGLLWVLGNGTTGRQAGESIVFNFVPQSNKDAYGFYNDLDEFPRQLTYFESFANFFESELNELFRNDF